MAKKATKIQAEASCCAPGCCTPATSEVTTRAKTPGEVEREAVRDAYAKVATSASGCCGTDRGADQVALKNGYTRDDLASAPDGANLGLGCGNPTALAELKPGEVVVDLGAGAGFDAFLCARRVGATGRVIGIDMTPEMLDKARRNAERIGATNVEFRQGFIEDLPVADGTADLVISNCVVNLSPDKPRVLREAFRVLKPGGRVSISDIATHRPLPQEVRDDVRALCACLAGTFTIDEYRTYLEKAGFVEIDVKVSKTRTIEDFLASDDPLVREVRKAPHLVAQADNFVSVLVSARRPGAR